jgi:hypothetical protein
MNSINHFPNFSFLVICNMLSCNAKNRQSYDYLSISFPQVKITFGYFWAGSVMKISLRATAWENWHMRTSNSHYFLLSWNSHQIFFSLYKKYKSNIFGLQNWAPPFLHSSKSQFCNFLEYALFLLIYLIKNNQKN